jgi:alanine racemase
MAHISEGRLNLRKTGSRFEVGAAVALSKHRLQINFVDEPSLPKMIDLCAPEDDGECAVSLQSHLLSIRTIQQGGSVSYGALFTAKNETKVGLVPVGFADGLDRLLTGKLHVSILGKCVPVIGRIAMDSISVDLNDVPSAKPGDSVIVYGKKISGCQSLTDYAAVLGITSVEIIERLSERAEVFWA